MPKKPMAPVRRVKPLVQAMNFGRSACRQTRAIRRSPTAAACAHIARRDRRGFLRQTARRRVRRRWQEYAAPYRGSARRRKASSTIPRSRVWSGSSIDSMLLATARMMPGIHHRSPATVPPSLRMVNVSLSFSTRLGQLLRRRDPDLADDREPDFDDRPGCPQPLDRGGGIAEILLAGEIRPCRHDLLMSSLREGHKQMSARPLSRKRERDARHLPA